MSLYFINFITLRFFFLPVLCLLYVLIVYYSRVYFFVCRYSMLCEVKHWLRTEELRAHFRVIAGFVLLGLELVTRFFMASWRKQGHPLAEHLHLLAVHAMNVHRLLLRHPCPACSRAAVFCSTILASAEYMLNPELLQATLASVIQ